jgi:hypothetical protein
MTTQELFELLEEEFAGDLIGELKYTGDVIKYQFDSFQQDTDDFDLDDVCYEDRTMIDDWLASDEEYEDFFTTEPEKDDTIIYFYIEK